MAPSSAPSPDLLEVRDLRIGLGNDAPPIVDGVSFRVAPGEIVGVVGESGSGKTLTGLSMLGLLPAPVRRLSGEILFDGRPVAGRDLVGRNGASMVFQEPASALHPLLSLGFQIGEALRVRHGRLPSGELRQKTVELLRQVAMPDPELRRRAFPHQVSGGQRQRAMLAMALASEPRLLIADEPTTALDVTVQAQILRLLRDLNRRLGLTLLLITHDLGVVAQICERVLVMDSGRLVEEGTPGELFENPTTPETRRLVDAGFSLGREAS